MKNKSAEDVEKILLDNITNNDKFSCLLLIELLKFDRKQDDVNEKSIEEKQNDIFDLDEEVGDVEKILRPEIYSYLLSWILLMMKISSPLIDERFSQVKKALNLYLEGNRNLYLEFLNNIFKWTSVAEKSIKFEMNTNDFVNIEPEW